MRRRSTVSVTFVFLLVTILVPVEAARSVAPSADMTVAHDRVVSPEPSAGTPHVLDGQVRSVAVIGDTVVLGGEFTQVSSPGGEQVYDRQNLVAFDRSTGEISQTFTPAADGPVEKVIAAPDGKSVFVGGYFDEIDGQGPRSLARLRLSDGARWPGFDPPTLTGVVHDLGFVDGRLWIAGAFTHIDGSRQPALATLNADTGAFDPYMNIALEDPRSGVRQVLRFDIAADGSRLVAVGNFTTADGNKRNQIVMLDLDTQNAELANWNTDFFTASCASGFDSYMRDVAFSPDSSWFAVVTAGGYGGGPPAPCDTTSRFEAGTTGEGIEPTWATYTGGDTLTAVEVTGAAVYVGGHFRWQNNPWGDNVPEWGAVPREGLAALDPAGGMPYSWNPTRTLGVGVFDLVATNAGLWMVSDTDQTGGEHHGRVAFFGLDGGSTPPDTTPVQLPADLYTAPTSPGEAGPLTKRTFDGTSEPPPGQTVDAGEAIDWSSIRGAFALAGDIYTGNADGTFTRRGFDGIGFGPAEIVDTSDQLTEDTAWHSELTRVTGMAAADGRIYYTRSGVSRLWSRTFNPESGIVGAERVATHTGEDDLDWSQVRGMVLTGDTLYFGYASSPATLRKVPFANGQPTGPVEVVATSAEYNTRAMFLHPSLPGTETVEFVDTAGSNGNHATFTVPIPETVQEGDRLLLFLTLNATDRTLTGPTGGPNWTVVDQQATSSAVTHLWQAEAGSDDAGATITVELDSYTKGALTVAAYRSTNPDRPITIRDHAAAPDTSATTSHTTPTLTNQQAGTWLISYWGEKSSGTTRWTPPDGHPVRSSTFGDGGGRIASLLADSGRGVPTGDVGGLTATTNEASRQASTWSVLLGSQAG